MLLEACGHDSALSAARSQFILFLEYISFLLRPMTPTLVIVNKLVIGGGGASKARPRPFGPRLPCTSIPSVLSSHCIDDASPTPLCGFVWLQR